MNKAISMLIEYLLVNEEVYHQALLMACKEIAKEDCAKASNLLDKFIELSSSLVIECNTEETHKKAREEMMKLLEDYQEEYGDVQV